MSDAPLPRTLPGWLPYLWQHVLFPGAAEPLTRIRPLSLLLVLLLPAALLYPCRDFLLLEPDEGRYAQIPKEMHDRNEWVVPTLQGEAYLDKPPLMYWLVRLSYAAFGVSESSARLVPAVCVHLTILAVYLIGRRSLGERAAFWAALLLTVAPGYLGVARLLLLDGLLTLCITTSVLCGFEAVRTGQLKLGWWIASAMCSGLGFLTKGPIAEVLLFPPLFAFALLNQTTARVGVVKLLLFAVIVLGISTPWYVAIYLRQPEFLKYFFWEHNVMRFLQPFDHLQPIWYYVPILLGGFLPGVILGVPYLRSFLAARPQPLPPTPSPKRGGGIGAGEPSFSPLRFGEGPGEGLPRTSEGSGQPLPPTPSPKRRGGAEPSPSPFRGGVGEGLPLSSPRSQAGGFWLLAGLWCVFFFSCSGSKLPTYILPAFPPLCLALGEFIARTRWNNAFATRGIVTAFALLLAVVHYVGVPWYARERSPMGRPELVAKYVSDPETVVVTYPRNCDSVAFYTGRSDLRRVRTKDVNQMIVDTHFRPKTVVLFTHAHSFESFQEALPPSVRVAEAVSLKRETGALPFADKLVGKTPWGLCDVAVLEPVTLQTRAQTP